MEEILMWSITGVVVVVLVIVTIVVVRCIWKNTPPMETEIVNHVGTKMDWKSRVVEYYRKHKYWKVTDKDAPKWDTTRPRTGTYTDGTIRSFIEAREEADKNDGIYSIGTLDYVVMN